MGSLRGLVLRISLFPWMVRVRWKRSHIVSNESSKGYVLRENFDREKFLIKPALEGFFAIDSAKKRIRKLGT
jgi:hypothetical protein